MGVAAYLSVWHSGTSRVASIGKCLTHLLAIETQLYLNGFYPATFSSIYFRNFFFIRKNKSQLQIDQTFLPSKSALTQVCKMMNPT